MGKAHRIREVGKVVETSKAINTDWFSSNLGGGEPRVPKTHVLMIMVNTTTVVQLLVDVGSDTDVTWKLNEGTALTANCAYVFHVPVYPGMTYNIQHATSTQDVNCFVMEQYFMNF